jgi:hypothetical protein
MKLKSIIGAFLAAGLLLAGAPASAGQSSVVMPTVDPGAGFNSFAAFNNTFLNPGLQALLSQNSGTVAPANGPAGAPVLFETWFDSSTTPPTLRYYDGAQWVAAGTLNTATHAFAAIGASPAGTSAQVQFNNAGAFGGFTVGGDATLNTATGALTVAKIGGKAVSLGGPFAVSGAFSATLTVTGATNVTLPTSGTLLATTGNGGSLTGFAYSQLPALSANQVLGALTAVSPSGLTMPSCSSSSDALIWTSGTGFGCQVISGSGTVTSVAMSIPTGFGIGGSPITASGTLALAWTGGTPSAAIDLLGSTQGDVLYRNGTVWTVLAPGTSGQVLKSGGSAANPSWSTITGTGTVTSVAATAPTGLVWGGSPITGAGTLALAWVGSGTPIPAASIPTTLVASAANVLALTNPSSAVDYVQVTGSQTPGTTSGSGPGTTGGPIIAPVGSDAVVGLNLSDKGGAGVCVVSFTRFSFCSGNPDANAVNGMVAQGADTGQSPLLFALGTDTNVSLRISGQGTGSILAISPFSAPSIDGYVYPMAAPYSCAGNGTTNDSTCMAAAEAAACNSVLLFGDHLYGVSATQAPGCAIRYQGTLAGWASEKPSGFQALAANMNLLTLTSGSTFENAYIGMNHSGVNTSGTAVSALNTAQVRVLHAWIDGACVAVSMSGNTLLMDDSYLSLVGGGTNCFGIVFGANTTQANTVDPRVTNSTVQGNQANPPAADQLIADAGGLFESNNDMLYGTVGTLIDPSAIAGVGQQVTTPFFSNTVLGDTTVNQALVINTASSLAWSMGGVLQGSWAASSSASDNVAIANSGGGVVDGWTFDAFRAVNSSTGSAFNLNGGTNITITGGSMLCGYNGSGTTAAIEMGNNVSHVKIEGVTASPTCMNQSSSGSGWVGLRYASGNNYVINLGNDFSGNSTEISGSPGTNNQTGYNN